MTQAALRVAGTMWALDPGLAQKRVFPAVDLEVSYTLFVNEILTVWPGSALDSQRPGGRAW